MIVIREHLLARLREARDARVVLLAAGAGTGKTTLLAQWAERDERPFAWVSLDETDDDPSVLAGDVRRALAAVGRDGDAPFVLVVDDAHVLRSPACLGLLAALADDLPDRCQLAIAGRGEPALPLARWSLQREVVRIGPAQLAMSRQEASAVMGPDHALGASELQRLLERTEGWAAGLRMAAIRLREDPSGGLGAFGGGDRLVADYLRDEVLAPLGDELTRLLVRTSVLDRLCGPLCDAVLDRRGCAAALREVARADLLLQPVDGARGWYRCHPLLRDALRADLRTQEVALEVELHRRASAWHEVHGDPHSAVAHARAAGDAGRAGDLVWAALAPLLCRGQLPALARWLAEFDEGELAAQPALSLAAAWCELERGDLAAAGRWCAIAEDGATGRPLPGGPASVAAAGAILRCAMAADGLARMARDAAVAAGTQDAGAWAALSGLLNGVALRLGGDLDGARASVAVAERHAVSASAPSPRARCLAQLALLAADADDWEEAARLVGSAQAVLEREGLQSDASAIEVCAVSALVLARGGLPSEAARDARRCLRLLAAQAYVPPWLAADVRILLARAGVLVGDAAAARALLRDGRRIVARMPDSGQLGSRLEAVWHRVEAFPQAGIVATVPLSRAELRVLRFLPTHLTYAEIGERLHVSRCTVKSQALSTYRKLDVSSRSQAVERAVEVGLLEAPPPRGGRG